MAVTSRWQAPTSGQAPGTEPMPMRVGVVAVVGVPIRGDEDRCRHTVPERERSVQRKDKTVVADRTISRRPILRTMWQIDDGASLKLHACQPPCPAH